MRRRARWQSQSARTSTCADSVEPARFTFAIARHAVVDLSYSYHVAPVSTADRLADEDLRALLGQLREADVHPQVGDNTVAERLRHMRALYEPYVCALTSRLELPLPAWLAPESPTDNWRNTEWH